ncbi:6-phosphogluconolactonase [Breoghania sp.]|uniref:6-phosphogluconolactonase n=1 Tax=Breoghania sp. TaxID=2065378 RepID=UPI002AAB6AE0|nr:6-phosphogluconolactonase [Breoghania sp.]
MTPKVLHYVSRDALAEGLASQLAARLRVLVDERGGARIAVPGGSTPGPMLERLGASRLPWEKVVVTLSDERWVPDDNPRSNARLLQETLLSGAAAQARFVTLYGGPGEPEERLGAVGERLLASALPLDIAVLGMGVDMHTASLFPGATGLEAALAADAPPILAIRTKEQPEARVTLSARVLRGAGERHILITGAEKMSAYQEALASGDPLVAPVCAVLEGATIHYAE